MRKLAYSGIAVILCGFLGGCSGQKTSNNAPKLFRMGERVQAGALIYTVLDTEWLDQLGDSPTPRLPHNRFLSVRISTTNSGTSTSSIPPAVLSDSQGKTYAELSEAEGLTEWFGYIRSVKSAETVFGRVLFDVAPGDYRLKVADDAEPENQKTATIELPLQLTRPQVRTEAPEGE
jgi:Domain of unknown function (DUF4352)